VLLACSVVRDIFAVGDMQANGIERKMAALVEQ
jgi:hypothetical protein